MLELPPDKEDLLKQLDPDRNYGVRQYQDVLKEVRAGTLLIEPGFRLPVLREAATGRSVTGTGRPPLGEPGMSIQQFSQKEFRLRAVEDMPQAYRELRNGMRKGDPRFHKIYWENLLGKVGEVRGGEAMAEAFRAMMELMQQPERRTVDVE